MKARFGNSNTTFVKVKSNKIKFYGFYYTTNSIDIQGLQLFFSNNNRFLKYYFNFYKKYLML